MKKLTTVLIAAIISLSIVAPVAASAQTTTSSEASLTSVLTQLVQLLEQELQQLIAMQGGPTHQPQPQPQSNFTASPISGAVPLDVQFTATPGYSETINFGDGSPTEAMPSTCTGDCPSPGKASHIYTSVGTYTATLTSNGQEVGSATVTVTGPSLSRAFSATPNSGAVPLTVQFVGTTPLPFQSYTIQFGDGQTATVDSLGDNAGGQIATSHTYTAVGTYTAKLVQQTNLCGGTQLSGCVSQLQVGSVTVTVSAGSQLNPTFSATPNSGAVPLTVQFVGTTPLPFQSYTIQFGDGQTATVDSLGDNAGGQIATSHTYTAVGTYTASVVNSGGATLASATITGTGSVATCNGIAAGNSNCLTATATSGSAPLTVTFTTESTPSGAYSISFADGSNSGQLAPQSCNSSSATCIYSTTHTYQSAGVYNAVLTGPQAVAGYVWITVGGGTSAPQLSSISPTTLSAGTQATLTGSGFLAQGDQIIVDGEYIVGRNANPTGDTSQTFTLPQYVSNKDACKDFYASLPAGTGGGCDPALIPLPAGQHTIVLQNNNGASNSLSFTSQ